MAALPDGRLLVADGSLLALDLETGRAQVLDFPGGAVLAVASSGGSTLAFTRSRVWALGAPGEGWLPRAANPHLLYGPGPVAVPLADGRVAVLSSSVPGSGELSSCDPSTSAFAMVDLRTVVDLYVPSTDAWIDGAVMPEAVARFAAVQVPEGRLLVAGGRVWPRQTILSHDGVGRSVPSACRAVERAPTHAAILLDLPAGG